MVPFWLAHTLSTEPCQFTGPVRSPLRSSALLRRAGLPIPRCLSADGACRVAGIWFTFAYDLTSNISVTASWISLKKCVITDAGGLLYALLHIFPPAAQPLQQALSAEVSSRYGRLENSQGFLRNLRPLGFQVEFCFVFHFSLSFAFVELKDSWFSD